MGSEITSNFLLAHPVGITEYPVTNWFFNLKSEYAKTGVFSSTASEDFSTTGVVSVVFTCCDPVTRVLMWDGFFPSIFDSSRDCHCRPRSSVRSVIIKRIRFDNLRSTAMDSRVRKCEFITSDEFWLLLLSRSLPMVVIRTQSFSISCSPGFVISRRIHRWITSSDIVPTRNSSPINVILPKTLRRFLSTRSWSSIFNLVLFSSVLALWISVFFSSKPIKSAPSLSNSFLHWASSKFLKETVFSPSVEEDSTAFCESDWHILAYVGAKNGSLIAFSKNSWMTPASLSSVSMGKFSIWANNFSCLLGVILLSRPRTVLSTTAVVISSPPAMECFTDAGLHSLLAARSLMMTGVNFNSLRGASVTCAPMVSIDDKETTFRFGATVSRTISGTGKIPSGFFWERKEVLWWRRNCLS